MRKRKHTAGQVETRMERAHPDLGGRQRETGSLATVDSKFHTEPGTLWSVVETLVTLTDSMAHWVGTMGAQTETLSEE